MYIINRSLATTVIGHVAAVFKALVKLIFEVEICGKIY